MKQRLDALRAHLEFHTFIPLLSNALIGGLQYYG